MSAPVPTELAGFCRPSCTAFGRPSGEFCRQLARIVGVSKRVATPIDPHQGRTDTLRFHATSGAFIAMLGAHGNG